MHIDDEPLGGRNESPLPIVARPAPTAHGASLDALVDGLRARRDELRRRVAETGAVLFRGFDVRGAADLARVVSAFSESAAPMSYVGGDTPRTRVGAGVYTSTECPPSVGIPL